MSICQDVGFPPPVPGVGLAEWADGSLDVALGPRGAPAWREGHEHTVAALEAALEGAGEIARAELRRAVALVRAKGRSHCVCRASERGIAMTATNGKIYCVKCGGRQ